jgi:hypothetical protein
MLISLFSNTIKRDLSEGCSLFVYELQDYLASVRCVDDDNSVACSPQANYTDRAAAACQRS